jgi:hypothetical protein
VAANLYLCFPYRDVGGVPLLFLRLAEELGRRGIGVSVVDYADGYMAKRHDPALMKLVVYPESGTVEIPANAVLVLQAMTPWSIFPRLAVHRNARLLFWNCHPFNLVPTLPGLRRPMMASATASRLLLSTLLLSWRTRMRRFVHLLLEKDALAFMDRTNVETTERCLGLRVPEPRMMAIPAQAASDRQHPAPEPGAGLRVAWVGRIVDFKYFPLVHALRRLDALQPALGMPVPVLIIGAGDYEARLREVAAGLTHITVTFKGEVEPQALQDLLAEQVDLLLAMGTSALEGVRLGVPTLLLDLSYGEIKPGCRFAWLHEQDGYSLAGIAQPCPAEEAAASLASRVQQLLVAPAEVSDAARRYYRNHHEISRIASRLTELTGQTRCTWGQLQDAGLLKRGLVYSLFSGVRDRGVRK